jgi:hypothetical protein
MTAGTDIMKRYRARAGLASTLLLCAVAFASSAARAGEAGEFVLACENGRSYPLRATAVSADGDLVAGYLMLGTRRGAHVRLVPMGSGYRYAGLGFWVDGWRQDAVLHLGKHKALSCNVLRGNLPYGAG